jgi:hypothetical protein
LPGTISAMRFDENVCPVETSSAKGVVSVTVLSKPAYPLSRRNARASSSRPLRRLRAPSW